MVTATTSGFTSICTANGRMAPEELPPVVEGDTVRICFDLKPFLAGDTVSGTYTLTDDPDELTIANMARNAANNQVLADLSGFKAGCDYTIELSATLTAGAVINKRVRIRCRESV